MAISRAKAILWPLWIHASISAHIKLWITTCGNWISKSWQFCSAIVQVWSLFSQLSRISWTVDMAMAGKRIFLVQIHIAWRSIWTWMHWLARMREGIAWSWPRRFNREARTTILIRIVLLTDAFRVSLSLSLLKEGEGEDMAKGVLGNYNKVLVNMRSITNCMKWGTSIDARNSALASGAGTALDSLKSFLTTSSSFLLLLAALRLYLNYFKVT